MLKALKKEKIFPSLIEILLAIPEQWQVPIEV